MRKLPIPCLFATRPELFLLLDSNCSILVQIWLTEWRGGLRRGLNKTDNVKSGRATDALLNYETVMYFSNEKLEVQRYADAVADYQVTSPPPPPPSFLFTMCILSHR